MEANCDEKRKKIFKDLLSWAIVIIFISVVGDWSCIAKRAEERERERVLVGSPEFSKLLKERSEILDRVKEAADKNTLTAREAVEAQNRVVAIWNKTEVESSTATSFIIQTFKESFIRNYKFPEDTPQYFKERYAGEYGRRTRAEEVYHFEINQAIAKYRNTGRKPFSGGDLLSGLFWLVKWYYLFTIPTILIVLMNVIFAGKSIAQKLWFDGRRIVLACFAGPIGVSLISESAGEIMRYQKLKAQYLEGKDRWHLSKNEEEAIWIQVMEPYLQFGDALKKVGTVTVKKPAIVCFVLWLLSLSMSSLAAARPPQQPEVTIENVAEAGTQEVIKEKSIKESSSTKLLVDNLIVVDEQLDFPKIEFSGTVSINEPISKTIYLLRIRPRGPPNPAAGRNANDSDEFLLTATSRKGEER